MQTGYIDGEKMNKIEQKVWELAEPVVKANGCELWDVEYVRQAGTNYLRVYIDREGGVNIDDCEAVSRELDPILDEQDPVPDSYTFEVSSAGLERALKRPSDFEKFMGSYVAVQLYSAKFGRKEHLGHLTGYDNGDVTVRCAEEEYRFTSGEVASVRLRME